MNAITRRMFTHGMTHDVSSFVHCRSRVVILARRISTSGRLSAPIPLLQILSMRVPAFTHMDHHRIDHAHRQWHHGLHLSQNRPVLQPGQELIDPSDLLKKSRKLNFGQHGWQSQWTLRPHSIDCSGRQRSLQNLTTENHQCLERLILSRRHNLPVDAHI